MKKQCNDEIVIESVSREVFDIILKLIYLGKVTLYNEIIYSVAKTADYLGLNYRIQRIGRNRIE